MVRVVCLFAALVWGQEPTQNTKTEIMPQSVELPKCIDQKQEVERLTKLLNFYQQQYFIMQAKMIEQQIAPPKPKPAQGEK